MKLLDKLVEKVTGKECIRVTYDRMANMVEERFIRGATDEFLDKLQKTVKCRGVGMQILPSISGTQTLKVHKSYYFLLNLFMGKDVVLDDDENKIIYDIKSTEYKKFYNRVMQIIDDERRRG